MLGLTAACGGDQALAPTAGPVAGPTAGGAAVTRSGVELLVLVDEAGQARRVLIVRDERDPRVRAVERLGFRTRTPQGMTAGGVDAATHQLFAAAEAKGLPVRFQQAEGAWTPVMESAIARSLKTPSHGSPGISGSLQDLTQQAAVEQQISNALTIFERGINEALNHRVSETSSSGTLFHQSLDSPAHDGTEGEPCAEERTDASATRRHLLETVAVYVAGLAAMVTQPELWPAIPVAIITAIKDFDQANDAYRRDMRTLARCEAAHPEYYRR
jgi:hypothetical protein